MLLEVIQQSVEGRANEPNFLSHHVALGAPHRRRPLQSARDGGGGRGGDDGLGGLDEELEGALVCDEIRAAGCEIPRSREAMSSLAMGFKQQKQQSSDGGLKQLQQ